MLVVQIDVVGAQTAERSLHGHADVGRGAVQTRAPSVGDTATELGGQHDLVPAPLDSPAHQLLVRVGPYASAVSMWVTPRSSALWIVRVDAASSLPAPV